MTCRKEKDEEHAKPGCESTSIQDVLLEVAFCEHLDPPLAPETQTGSLQAVRNYLLRYSLLSQGQPSLMTAEKLWLVGDLPWSLLSNHGDVVFTAFPPTQIESHSAEAENGQ